MTERFQRAYDALYEGFMKGTLAKGTCMACAVGNICGAARGLKPFNEYDKGSEFYKVYSHSDNYYKLDFWIDLLAFRNYPEFSISKSSHAGYTLLELDKIEKAFESNTHISWSMYPQVFSRDKVLEITEQDLLEDQFNGLMAVMDVLIELDDIQEGEEKKAKFKNKFQVA